VQRHIQGVMGSSIITLLQIYGRDNWWKRFENRSRFDRVILSWVCCFGTHCTYRCSANVSVVESDWRPVYPA